MSFSGAAPPHHTRFAITVRVKLRGRGHDRGRGLVLGIACGQTSDPSPIRPVDQTLRVPARVVMLGPPYPLISPMSRVRI